MSVFDYQKYSMSGSIYVDLHVIHTVPFNKANTGDDGCNKVGFLGGVSRGRFSSQSLYYPIKIATRESGIFDKDNYGHHSKMLGVEVASAIMRNDASIDREAAMKLAIETVNLASDNASKPIIKTSKPSKNDKTPIEKKHKNDPEEGLTSAVLCFTNAQVAKIAELAMAWRDTGVKPSKEKVTAALNYGPSLLANMRGRMLGAAHDVDVSGAVSIAHAFTTHALVTDYDMFTAIDELSGKKSAAFMDSVDFSSGTFYKFASVHFSELYKAELGSERAFDAMIDFMLKFFRFIPQGKKNSYHCNTPPDGMIVNVRTDRSMNLSGAFDRPVIANGQGYVRPSVQRLVEYSNDVYATSDDAPVASWVVGNAFSEFTETVHISVLAENLYNELKKLSKDIHI